LTRLGGLRDNPSAACDLRGASKTGDDGDGYESRAPDSERGQWEPAGSANAEDHPISFGPNGETVAQ
jgi:hypothetical protein